MARKTNEHEVELVQNAMEAAADNAMEMTETAEVSEQTEKPEVPEMGGEPIKDDGYVEYCLPFMPGVKPGDSQTVTINGKNYQVKYGEVVRVPVGVAEILKEMVKANGLIEEKIKRLQQETCITKLE